MKMKGRLLKTLLVCVLYTVAFHAIVNAVNTVNGTVVTVDGAPIEGACIASVTTFVGTPAITDSDGRFNFSVSSSAKYLIVYCDSNSTPGWDYTPAKVTLEEAAKDNLTVKLLPAASVN
jgi:hypothetical protein